MIKLVSKQRLFLRFVNNFVLFVKIKRFVQIRKTLNRKRTVFERKNSSHTFIKLVFHEYKESDYSYMYTGFVSNVIKSFV